MNQESAWDRAHSLTVSCLRFVRLLELVSAARFVLGRGKGGGIWRVVWLGLTPRQEVRSAFASCVRQGALCEARASHCVCSELQGFKRVLFSSKLNVFAMAGPVRAAQAN